MMLRILGLGSMAMMILQAVLIIMYTAVLGTAGILLCLLVPGGSALMPLARLWSWLVMRTCRVGYRVSRDPGAAIPPAAIYIANHQSQFDIPALTLAMPVDFRMVAKRSLQYIPVFGWALWLAGFIFIDRSNRERAIRSLDRAAARLKRGTSVVIFAEGTRSTDGELLPFKRGGFVLAIQAGVPIVPVTLHGGLAILPKGSLRLRPGTIEVHFGAPIDTRAYTYDTREALMARTRDAVASALRRT
jgi:1-acyl-sn-glycerol-3-phosphate acyltransferase